MFHIKHPVLILFPFLSFLPIVLLCQYYFETDSRNYFTFSAIFGWLFFIFTIELNYSGIRKNISKKREIRYKNEGSFMLKKEFQKQRIEELSPEIVEVGLKIAGKMDDNRDIYSYSNPFKMHGTFAELYEFSVVKDRLHWKGGPLVAGGLDNLKGLRMLEDRLESYPDV